VNSHIALGLVMLAGAALGAAAVEGLHAQPKPPIYLVTEINTPSINTYLKEYAPLVEKSIKGAGGRIVAAGPAKSIEGEPTKTRIAIEVWDSEEKMQAWRSSAEYKKIRELGSKIAKSRSFFVDGTAN
jgi:uncharacterized protein (DUF1330 family)